MIYLIMGMHKSGTSLISKILHQSGINMGYFREDVTYDLGNHYERFHTSVINYALLKTSPNTNSLKRVSKNSELHINESLKFKIEQELEYLNNRYVDWGFKDPLNCFTYNIWKKYLPKHKVIMVFRHPEEVFQHYNNFETTINPLTFLKKFRLLWRVTSNWYWLDSTNKCNFDMEKRGKPR